MAGRGRGRGGGAPGMLKGATWEYDPTITLESKPTELFPPHPNIKKPAPLSQREKRAVQSYRTLQTQIHRGPLYTQPTKRDPDSRTKTFSEEQFNHQYGSNRKADMDPFNGVETYAMRYAPPKNVIPQLSGRPFNKSLFPEELWSTLEGEEGSEVRKSLGKAIHKKSLMLSAMADPTQREKILLEKIHDVAGDDDADEAGDAFEDEVEVDQVFDDDDLGDDYNAEQYFDGGEDGNDDLDGGGGEGEDF